MSCTIVTDEALFFKPTLVDIPNGDPGVRYALVPKYGRAYAAGTDGGIWCCLKIGGNQTTGSQLCSLWRKRKLTTRKSGHLFLTIWDNGETTARDAHCLVLEAWIGSCPPKMECRHKNGKPWDNRLDNLEWNTRRVNNLDRRTHGQETFSGEGHPESKLTDEEVVELRNRHSAGESIRDLAAEKQLSNAAIQGAVRGRTWSHVPGALPNKFRRTLASKDERDLILKLASDGLTTCEICQQTGLEYHTVYYYVKKRVASCA